MRNQKTSGRGFLEGLKHDAEILKGLVREWESVAVDPKLDEFLLRLRTKLLDRRLNETEKLVIFSEARDTTAYIADQLSKAGFGPLLTVDSHNRKAVMPIVRANFDANISKETPSSEKTTTRSSSPPRFLPKASISTGRM